MLETPPSVPFLHLDLLLGPVSASTFCLPMAAARMPHELGGLNQQKFILSQSWGWKSRCGLGCAASEGSRGGSFLLLQFLRAPVFRGWWLGHPSLCPCPHMAFSSLSLGVVSSSGKDNTHRSQGPP